MSSQHEMWNEELLSAYLDGECSDEERVQVEDQVAAVTRTAAAAQRDRVHSDLGALPPPGRRSA